jgi:hypothetical protein
MEKLRRSGPRKKREKEASNMNPKYYVTAEECEKVRLFLNKHGIGGGVVGGSENTFLGPFVVPQVEGKLMFNLRLANGCEMNAGLTLDLMSKGYAEDWVATMLQAMARPEYADA